MNKFEKPMGKKICDTGRNIKRFLSYHLDEYSLGDGQFGILYEIAGNEGISQEQISKNRNVDKATIAKAVKKLIDNDYIYRVKDKQDKRAYCLYCTEKGIKFIPEIKRIIILENATVTKGFTQEEVDLLSHLLERVTTNIDDFFEKEK